LIGGGVAELHIAAARLIGSAPVALESALRALAALSIDSSGVPIAVNVVGVPPNNAVVAWEEASVAGQPLTSQVAPHVLAGLNAKLPGRRFSCFVHVGNRRVAAMPVELGEEGVSRVLEPVLTRQERTRLENAIENC
jgi:malate/lactate dehydrogenase